MLVLVPLAAAPALLAAGLTVATTGAVASTQAKKAEVQAEEAKAELTRADSRIRAVKRRAAELMQFLADLSLRAGAGLDLLESELFDSVAHAERFAQAVVLTVAVRDLVAVPVMDSGGGASKKSVSVVVRCRKLVEGGSS